MKGIPLIDARIAGRARGLRFRARAAARPAIRASLALLGGVACNPNPPSSPIRDVRPAKLERDEHLVIEGRGFVAGAPTRVTLRGTFARPPAAPAPATVDLPARAVSPDRVLLDADAALQDRLGRATFTGTVTVVQEVDGAERALSTSERAPVTIAFFPPSVRKLAFALIEHRGVDRLETWLDARFAEQPDGVTVAWVGEAFDPEAFLDRHDTPPIDGKVRPADLGEAWASYAWLDGNGDGAITAVEAQHHVREAGPAARAGLAAGDRIVKVNGRELREVAQLLPAWEEDAERVEVEVSRRAGDKVVTATVSLPRHGMGPEVPPGMLAAGIAVAAAGLLIALLGPLGGLIVVAERRISAQMQSRIGPNRVGPQGLLQWLADGIKLITKEDVIPTEADPVLFRLSPYLVWMGIFATFVVLPFSQVAVVADMDIGILYLLSVTALVVVGVIMGGWASNSKWSLLGGMRSAAQIISYEIPASIALLSVVVLAGTLSPQGIIRGQGGAPWDWYLFANPFTFACFFIFFISALAEGNRTPFDLPEAESELVSGYNTEYSGFRFSVFFLGEWVNLYVIGAVVTTLFLGGWQVPGVAPAIMEANLRPPPWAIALCGAAFAAIPVGYWFLSRRYRLASALIAGAAFFAAGAGLAALGWQAVGLVAMQAKVFALVFVVIWIRWTVPRFRVDQMMAMCWKYLVPISLACFVGSAAWVWALPAPARAAASWALFAVGGLGVLAVFLARVRANLGIARRRVWSAFPVQ